MPVVLKGHTTTWGDQNLLESTENTITTTRSHLTVAVREYFEQMHRGDHFIFECLRTRRHGMQCECSEARRTAKFFLEGPVCRWHLLSGESPFFRG